MIKSLLSLTIFLISYSVSGQGTCKNAAPFCTSNIYTFPASTNTVSPAGPNYGCLFTQPNPAWYYMRIATSGDIVISMASVPAFDIDYVCWGPYTTPTGPCLAGLTGSKIVSCSYSAAPTETCTIPSGMVGEFYMLLITNYSNLPCNITFTKTGGTGATDCSIVGAAVPLTLVNLDATVKQQGIHITWETQSESGTSNFQIERSDDGFEFQKIAQVQARGGNHQNQYSFDDHSFKGKRVFYRLKEIYSNGTSLFSFPVMVKLSDKFQSPDSKLLQFQNGDLVLDFESRVNGKILLNLLDITGRQMLFKDFMVQEGDNHFEFQSEELPNGVYVADIEADGKHHREKILIQ